MSEEQTKSALSQAEQDARQEIGKQTAEDVLNEPEIFGMRMGLPRSFKSAVIDELTNNNVALQSLIAIFANRLDSREVFIQKALISLASNPYFFQNNGLQDHDVVVRLRGIATSMWNALNPQQAAQPQYAAPAPAVPPPAPPQMHIPQPQPAVAPPAQAAPAGPAPAYQPLPGFQGLSQQVSVGGVPTVQSQAVPMGATVATPYAGGVGSGVPSFQQPMAGGNKVTVIAENFAGQNLGPGQIPSAPMAPVAVPQVTTPQQPGRF